MPGARLPLIIGGVVLAYGAVLIAGYGIVVAGLATIAAGVGITHVDYAWLCRQWIACQIWLALSPAARLAGDRPRPSSRHPRMQRRARMRSRAVAVAVAVLGFAMPLSPASAAAPDLTYGGTTSQGNPVYLELAPGGRAVKRVLGTMELKCRDGSFQIVDSFRSLRISRRRFASSYSYPDRFGDEFVRLTGSITGQLDRQKRTITGSWTSRFQLENRATGESDDCSATTRFRLHR